MRLKIIGLLLLLTLLTGCGDSNFVKRLALAERGLYSATLSHDGQFALIAAIDSPSGLWDLKQYLFLYEWRQDQLKSNDFYFTAMTYNKNYALTSDYRNTVLWGMQTGKSYDYWRLPERVNAIAISANARFAAFALDNRATEILAVRDGRTLRRLPQDGPINDVAIANNGRYIITGSDDKTAVVWDFTTGKAKFTWAHGGHVLNVAFSPLSRLAATNDARGPTTIWGLTTGRPISELAHRRQSLSALRFSPDERTLATGTPSGQLQLWDVKTGALIKTWQHPRPNKYKPSASSVLAIAFGKDNQLVSVGSDGYVYFWATPAFTEPADDATD